MIKISPSLKLSDITLIEPLVISRDVKPLFEISNGDPIILEKKLLDCEWPKLKKKFTKLLFA